MGADLSYSDLSSANLRGSNLTDANLEGANMADANCWGATFSGANMNEVILKGTDFRMGADLSSAVGLSKSSLDDAIQ
jgi:uncharacterized protein YjbI with pentapeptide repeats